MESSWLTILPNLSIGVISVLSLVAVCYWFINYLEKQHKSYFSMLQTRAEMHEKAMLERETQIRVVEKEVRTKVLDQLQQNSMVMSDTVKSHERLMMMLDNKK